MSNRLRTGAAFAAASLLALCAGQAWSQNPAPVSNEAAPREALAAALAKQKALVEADKLHPHMGGVWKISAYVAALKTVDGKLPPLNGEGSKLYKKHIADKKAGKSEDLTEVCLPAGTPRAMYQDMPFVLTQTPAKITIFHQFNHIVRHAFMDGPLTNVADLDPNWGGYSSARWEGDILVIETGGFNGKLWLDEAGLPQSPKMKVTERFKLTDGGQTLEDTILIEDPTYYSKPWTTVATFKRQPKGVELVEDNCSFKLTPFPLKPYAPGD